ncbi:MAG: N-acetyltransferase [Candidatus Marinimicrobia bacterium]|nr:N-acetyltransferase [Candidatus Neomarinimicrobiota bacterium]
MIVIRHETQADLKAIHEINLQAFEQSSEGDIVDALRVAGALTMSLVALSNNQIVGHITFSPVTIESKPGSFIALGLGPMAVLPEYQNKGIGSQLVETGLKDCLSLGHEIVVVVGHPKYYPRFGFIPAGPLGIECEYEVPENAFMLLELNAGALAGRTGMVKFHPAFDEN